MTPKKIKIFDTTLRDGEQSPGASMFPKEKLEIATALDDMGVDIIEAGFAFASKSDFEAISEISKSVKNATVCSLARSLEADINAANEAIRNAKKPRIHIFLATSEIHLKYKLNKTQDEILDIIYKSIKYARNLCDDIQWSAEDASRTDIDFLIKCIKTAIKAGANTINLPDTVGFSTPDDYKKMFNDVISNIDCSKIVLSTHCHNDLGMATANALCGILGGASQVECTINGIGERAGNTALEEIIMAFKVRQDLGYTTNIDAKKITNISKLVQKTTGFVVQPNKAIVGRNAFLHESGIHQDGILKNKNTYEIINQEDVGINVSPIRLGKLSGRSALRDKLKEFGYQPNEEDFIVIFDEFKIIAASKKFILDQDIINIINKRSNHKISNNIEFVSYNLLKSDGENKKICITLNVDGKNIYCEEDGNGIIDAIFTAINKLIKIDIFLYNYTLNALSSDTNANAIAFVMLLYKNDKIFEASAIDTDTVIASIKAYINCINKIFNSTKHYAT